MVSLSLVTQHPSGSSRAAPLNGVLPPMPPSKYVLMHVFGIGALAFLWQDTIEIQEAVADKTASMGLIVKEMGLWPLLNLAESLFLSFLNTERRTGCIFVVY